MTIKEILEMNPVLVTGIATSFVGVVGALGLKELLAKAVERYWHKADQKETDHEQLLELAEKVDKIIEKLEVMEAHDRQGARNDLILLETNLCQMQNRAIVKGKVSATCMPRYLRDYELYIKLAEETEGYSASEEIRINHKRIQKLVEDGFIADSVEEWYK